jgi:hypothetical protein
MVTAEFAKVFELIDDEDGRYGDRLTILGDSWGTVTIQLMGPDTGIQVSLNDSRLTLLLKSLEHLNARDQPSAPPGDLDDFTGIRLHRDTLGEPFEEGVTLKIGEHRAFIRRTDVKNLTDKLCAFRRDVAATQLAEARLEE